MVGWFTRHRWSPIGIDIGSRSVKLLQLDRERTQVVEAARWDLTATETASPEERDAEVVKALERAREGRQFRGREAVFSLGAGNLFVQNIRVPHATGAELNRIVCGEAANRVPFAKEEAEVRFLEAADVRQGRPSAGK